MAGEWLKFEKATPDKPEVFAAATALGIDPDAVVGKLIRVWSWFDTHTVDGNARSVTPALLDRVAGVAGFAIAMANVGWLVISDEGVTLPKFGRHTGETAKGRALSAKRSSAHREKSNGESHAESVTEASPTEEKKREEKKEQEILAPAGADLFDGVAPQVVADFRALRKAKKAAITATAVEGIRREAAKAGMTLEAALELCCLRGWTGFKAEWVTGVAAPSATSTKPGGGRREL